MSDPLSNLPPVIGPDARLLILGSLPGTASLAAQRYYAHPRNQFWRLVGDAIGRDLASLSYEERLNALRAARIGLWDTVASARRVGSLDTALRETAPSDLASLVSGLPDLQAIAFNGGTAARIGRKALAGLDGPTLIDLPSSSPAYTRPFESKQESWSTLRNYVDRVQVLPERLAPS